MRHLICSAPLVVLLGCAGTVEVEGVWSSDDGEPYVYSEPLTDGPHMRLVDLLGDYDSYFDVELLQADSLDGFHDGWCTNQDRVAPATTPQPVELYWSSGEVPDDIVRQPDNLDLVNYLLNTYDVGDPVPLDEEWSGSPVYGPVFSSELQLTIWALLDHADGEPDPERLPESALVAEARAEGEGFVPGCGDIEVVLAIPLDNLDDLPGNDVQTAAVEVPVPPSHCR